MLSRSATTVTKPVIPAKAWKKIEAESGVSLSKLKKPVATISKHVQLKVASLDLEKHMGDQHVELDIHWHCSKLDIIEETWASGKGSQSATEKNGQDPEYAVCDAYSLVSQDSQVRIKDRTDMLWKKNHDKTVHQCNVLEMLQQLDPSWSRCVQVEIHSKNIQSSHVHVHPPQMIQLSAGVPQNNNSYGLEEEHDSMWAVLAVMDIPIATAISQGVAGCNKRHCTGPHQQSFYVKFWTSIIDKIFTYTSLLHLQSWCELLFLFSATLNTQCLAFPFWLLCGSCNSWEIKTSFDSGCQF